MSKLDNQEIFFSWLAKNLEHSIGVNVRDTIKETRMPLVTTIAKDSKKRPTIPSIKITGPKIHTKAIDEARTAKTTSLLPFTEALKIFLSIFLWCLKIFSRTTIESSTTIPMRRINANRVILLKVKL